MIGNVQDIDIKLLRVFRTIVKHGGFSAAQAELNTSQATISVSMRQLEERVGRRLCYRGQSGFKLTEAGQTLCEASDRLFTALEDFGNDVASSLGDLRGDLRIGVLDNLATNSAFRLPAAIADFRDIAPDVQLHVRIDSHRNLETQVLEGNLHLAIGGGFHRVPALAYDELFIEPQQLYCGRGNPLFERPDSEISERDIERSAYFLWEGVDASRGSALAVKMDEQGVSADAEAVVYAILSGRFLGYLPVNYAEVWVARGLMRGVLPERSILHESITLMTRKAYSAPLFVGLFIETLKNLQQRAG